jgi:uncharacterized protein (PEP-CTERM system associated)
MGTDPTRANEDARPIRHRQWSRTGAAALSFLAGPALAFPSVDATNQGYNAATSALSAPDARDLTHQLQISNGLPAAGTDRGWIIRPRLTVEEALTDNVLQVHSPMRWDLTTAISPGISIAGQTPRAVVHLDYAPVLIVNARTGSQNALNQQLNATASIMAIEEFAFIDIRALSGVQSLRGAAGAGGTIGASGGGGFTAGSATGTGGGALTGNSQQTTVQTASIGISPYLVKRFGDIGTARIGYSLNLSQSSPVTGIQLAPFPTGAATQRFMTSEWTAQFRTGNFLNDFQDTINLDFSQSNGSGQNNLLGSITTGNNSLTSNRQIISNDLSYAVSHKLKVTVSIGHEKIVYSGSNIKPIDDVTWSFGTTYTPNAHSEITISYGHQLGAQSLSFLGHVRVTPRTTISASYSDTLGTQLENLQNQLNQGVVGANGSFVNAQTGGQLFGSTNATPPQSGVFRFKTLTATATTQLNRDTISLTLNASSQTSAGGTASSQPSSQSNGVILQWTHELRPDMRLSTSASFNTLSGGFTGSSRSIAFNTGLIYNLTESVSASARYSFFKSTSPNTLFDLYEDIFVLGVTKQF